jgi:hypothetical protein
MGYLARELRNGVSAKAINMYVPPLALLAAPPFLNLNPLERISNTLSVPSEELRFACKYVDELFDGFNEVSSMIQLPVESDRLYMMNLGLNPQNTNGPSVLPLPV